MKSQAIAAISKMIEEIVWESPDDEGAAEWEYHLFDVQRMLQNNTMTVEEAESSLGVQLVNLDNTNL